MSRSCSVLLLGLLMATALLSGCASGTKSFLDVQSVSGISARPRPLVIEVKTWKDNREHRSPSDDPAGLVLPWIPLVPFVKVETQSAAGAPVRPKIGLKNMNIMSGIVEQQSYYDRFSSDGQHFLGEFLFKGDYDIPALLAAYLGKSGLTRQVLLEGAPYQDQIVAYKSAGGTPPEADIIINTQLDSYKFEQVQSSYGLTGLASVGTLFLLYGENKTLLYDYTFEAVDANTGKTILTRRYNGKVSTGFIPVFGIQTLAKNDIDLLGVKAHESCRDFVTELDKALTAPEETVYWASVDRAREIRVAKASGKPVSQSPEQIMAAVPTPLPSLAPAQPAPATGLDALRQEPVADAAASADSGQRTQIALVIGINQYQFQPPLQNAVPDAKAVAQVLRDQYGFAKVIELFDAQATKEGILDSVMALVDSLKGGEDILIYYSGHGYLNKTLNVGYWVPVNAQKQSDFLNNSEILDYIKAMNRKKVRHVFLIADSCFSGSFIGTMRAINVRPPEGSGAELNKYLKTKDSEPSRYVLTSGGNEPVLDGGGDGHSIFATQLLKFLGQPEFQAFTASELSTKVGRLVGYNGGQTPCMSAIIGSDIGHGEGDFVFVKKK